jgi:hypothetical protein
MASGDDRALFAQIGYADERAETDVCIGEIGGFFSRQRDMVRSRWRELLRARQEFKERQDALNAGNGSALLVMR